MRKITATALTIAASLALSFHAWSAPVSKSVGSWALDCKFDAFDADNQYDCTLIGRSPHGAIMFSRDYKDRRDATILLLGLKTSPGAFLDAVAFVKVGDGEPSKVYGGIQHHNNIYSKFGMDQEFSLSENDSAMLAADYFHYKIKLNDGSELFGSIILDGFSELYADYMDLDP